MAIFLTSSLNNYYKDEEGNKVYTPFMNDNAIIDNIRKYLRNENKMVYVANNPDNIEENDIRLSHFSDSLDMSGFRFKKKILLDSRNRDKAKLILTNADLVILSGGKCLCELDFFNEINLKDIIKSIELRGGGVIIGISAGSMNLCKIVANFPEELIDLEEPRWLDGLGFFDRIIIPHFDGERENYQFETEIDLINDYVLPMSKGKEFIGIPNGSYILLDNKKIKYIGDMYKISNGKVVKFN